MRLTCGDCNCFRPQTYLDENDSKQTIGICLCHGYHIKSNEEICVDFEK